MAGVRLREAMLGGKIKLGNKTYSVKEVRTSDGVVWPYEQYTYRVTGFSLKYSAGASLLATATNYAYIQATIAKINREGQVVETSTVDAAPTFVSGTNYYSVSNAHILFNKTKYGKSVIASRSTDKFSATCTTPDGIVWQSEEFSVSFAGNARTFNLISANVSLSLTESEISCITVENVARVQLSRTYYYSYTSQLRDDDVTDTGSSASIYLGDSYVGDIEHDHSLKLNVGTNVNTLIERDFDVKASYYSQNDSKSFTQGADHPTGDIATPVPGTYQVVISEVENTVSATGGKAILGVSAIHTENVVNKYYYGGEIISQKQRTADDGVSYAISGTDDAKSRYTSVSFVSARLSMVHSNMAKRSTGADNITVTFTNSSDSSATASKSFSPTNAKTTTAAYDGPTLDISAGVDHDYLDAVGGVVTVSGTRHYYHYAEAHSWESGASDGGDRSDKYATIATFSSITVSPTATVSGSKVTIGARKYNTSSTVFTITAKYDGKQAQTEVERLGDYTYTGAQYTRDSFLRVEGAGNTIAASGGSRKYDISAGHTLVTPKYWASDNTLESESTSSVTDKWKYSKSGTGASYYKNFSVSADTASSASSLSFDHENMAKNERTDSLKIVIVSVFDSSKTFTESFSPTNTKTETIGEKQYGTPTSTTTTGYQAYAASISANRYTSSSSPCPASGGTATLSWSGSHQERTETKTSTPWNRYKLSSWTSGSTQSDLYDSGTDVSWSYGSWTTKTDTLTPTSQGTSGFTRSGSTVTVDSENRTTYSSGRSCTYTVTNGSATKTVTIYQQANVKTTGTWTYQYALSCSDMSTVPATQTTRTMSATSTRSRTDTWTSGAQDTTTEDYSSSVSVSPSGAAMVPETFSGSGTFRCVIQANTGAQRSVTVSMGGKSVTFTQAAYVPPAVPTVTITAGSSGTGTRKTITIKASFADYSGSVSLSGVSIIYNRQGGAATTYNVSDTVTLSPSSDTYTSGLRIMGVSGDIFVVKISATSATPTSVTFKYVDKEIPF